MSSRAGRPVSSAPGSLASTVALATLATLALAAAVVLGACSSADATPPPIDRPGTPDQPREVNIVAKDYLFVPPEVRLIPGETVLLHVVNGGLAVHEVVIGDGTVQDAWEIAEAQTEGAPPGPTPFVGVPPGVGGLRIVVGSGERRDVLYRVPDGGPLVVGCHIPGHYAKGMHVPVRFVAPGD